MDLPQPYSDVTMLVVVIAISFWGFFWGGGLLFF